MAAKLEKSALGFTRAIQSLTNIPHASATVTLRSESDSEIFELGYLAELSAFDYNCTGAVE